MEKPFELWLRELVEALILSEYGKKGSWKFRNEKLEIAQNFYRAQMTPANAAAKIIYPEFILRASEQENGGQA